MVENLQELYRKTRGFTKIPPDMQPQRDTAFAETLREKGITLLAQKFLPDKGFFVICKSRGRNGVWMETFRADGTRCARQQYQPDAYIYALMAMEFDAGGRNITHLAASAKDGRLVEEVTRTPEDELERTMHVYADMDRHQIAYESARYYGMKLSCKHVCDRIYRDEAGTWLEEENYFTDGILAKKVHYHEDGYIDRVQENHPGSAAAATVRLFDAAGLNTAVQRWDKDEKASSYVEYHTEGDIDPANLKKKREITYLDGSAQKEYHYYEDGEKVKSAITYHPNSVRWASRTNYTEAGLVESETQWNINGKAIRHVEYHTEGAADPSRRIKKREVTYEDGFPQAERRYHKDGRTLSDTIRYHPRSNKYAFRATFTESGQTHTEREFNADGKITHYVEYYTEGLDDPANPPKKLEHIMDNNVLKTQFRYRNDGTLYDRMDIEADGKTVKERRIYNITGEHALDIRYFEGGVIVRQVLMEVKDDTPEIKAEFTFKGGKPVSGRQRYTVDGETFWSNIEYDPQTGNRTLSDIPYASGRVRHHYDEESERVKETEFFSEPALGEKLQRVVHYYPAPPMESHPEQNTPLIPRKVDFYDEDGYAIVRTNEFRTDKTIKFRGWRDDEGQWIRRAYAPGTKQADDGTPAIFESITGPDGKLEQSVLFIHPDPGIISVKTEYKDGAPDTVTIRSMDTAPRSFEKTEETISWKEYAQRKARERLQWKTGPVRMATIAPLQEGRQDDNEVYSGSTVITLQGDEESLRKTAAKLRHKIADIRCELCIGAKQWQQVQGETGHYIDSDDKVAPAKPVEKVNVLKVTVPYTKQEGDKWPQIFPLPLESITALIECHARAEKEAVKALMQVFRNTSCDLGLALESETRPVTAEGKPEEYQPVIRITWPNAGYLPPTQCETLSGFMQEQVLRFGKHLSDYQLPTGIPNGIDAYAGPPLTEKKEAAEKAETVRTMMYEGLVPASVRESQRPGAQL